MTFIDTHSHIYLENFDQDRETVINNCKDQLVNKIFLPNIDPSTIESVKLLSDAYPNMCFAMNGLHPCNVKTDIDEVLQKTKAEFDNYNYVAVGEIGIDFYWDTSFAEEQIYAFKKQIAWSTEKEIPFVIHSRSSLDLTIRIVGDIGCKPNQCIFHCFDGTLEQAQKIVELGMKMGIGGPVTYKKSKLIEVVKTIELSHFVLETDSPYLAPSPHRGQRNESSYIPIIAKRIADIKEITIEEVADVTTNSAKEIFSTIDL